MADAKLLTVLQITGTNVRLAKNSWVAIWILFQCIMFVLDTVTFQTRLCMRRYQLSEPQTQNQEMQSKSRDISRGRRKQRGAWQGATRTGVGVSRRRGNGRVAARRARVEALGRKALTAGQLTSKIVDEINLWIYYGARDIVRILRQQSEGIVQQSVCFIFPFFSPW